MKKGSVPFTIFLSATLGTAKSNPGVMIGTSVGEVGFPSDGLVGAGIEIALPASNAFSFLQTDILDKMRPDKPFFGYVSIRICPQTNTLLGMPQWNPSVMIEVVSFGDAWGREFMSSLQANTLARIKNGTLDAMLHWGLENEQLNGTFLKAIPALQRPTQDSAFSTAAPDVKLSKLEAFAMIRSHIRAANGSNAPTLPRVFDNVFTDRIFHMDSVPFIRGVLLVGRFRTEDELNQMPYEVQRNTLISELANRSSQPTAFFQSLDNFALAGAGALLVFLREARIRDDATLKTMRSDDMRNTLIVETTVHSGLTVPQLQAMDNIHLVTTGLGQSGSFIRGALLVGRFRTKDELNAMSDEDQRNTLITELANRSNQPVGYFQGLDNGALAGAGAVLDFLREANIQDDAALKTMSDDDMRNTMIVETAFHSGLTVPQLQAMDNIHLVATGLSDSHALG